MRVLREVARDHVTRLGRSHEMKPEWHRPLGSGWEVDPLGVMAIGRGIGFGVWGGDSGAPEVAHGKGGGGVRVGGAGGGLEPRLEDEGAAEEESEVDSRLAALVWAAEKVDALRRDAVALRRRYAFGSGQRDLFWPL